MKILSLLFVQSMGRFSIKSLGLVAQLFSLVLIAQMLGPHQFAEYALVSSSASIAAQIVDFGLSRYIFRLGHRGFSVSAMVRWSVSCRLVMTSCLVVPVTLYAMTAQLPFLAFVLAFGSSVLFQLTNLNRCVVLLRDRTALAILVESAPALVYCIILAMAFVAGASLDIDAVMAVYLLATVLAFAASVWLADSLGGWTRGLGGLLRQRPARLLRGVRTLLARSAAVGIEIVFSVTLINLPIIIARHLGYVDEAGVLAVFQRLLGLSVALISVSILTNLKRYYSDGAKNVFNVSPAVFSGVTACLLTWVALTLVSLVGAFIPALSNATMFSLLLALGDHKLLAALAIMGLAIYIHISYAALGGDRLIQRCLATASGILALLLASILLRWVGLGAFDVVYGAFAVGALIAILVLLSLISLSGARLRVFKFSFPPAKRYGDVRWK